MKCSSMVAQDKQFDFGENWIDFSETKLDQNVAKEARLEFERLFQDIPLENKSFLDIGFGQGLSLISAQQLGAATVGNDINEKCEHAFRITAEKMNAEVNIPIVIGSILDGSTVETLRELSPDGQGYDIVHSWGVLHHTGDMNRALLNAASLVNPNGYFVIAIYKRHITSPAWVRIKKFYVESNKFVQDTMVKLFIPVIAVARFIANGQNPFSQRRGMRFYHNVIDWVGGYPYEYGSKQEIVAIVKPLGFETRNYIEGKSPIACNEYVFQKK